MRDHESGGVRGLQHRYGNPISRPANTTLTHSDKETRPTSLLLIALTFVSLVRINRRRIVNIKINTRQSDASFTQKAVM